jgi:hypothetical protein
LTRTLCPTPVTLGTVSTNGKVALSAAVVCAVVLGKVIIVATNDSTISIAIVENIDLCFKLRIFHTSKE